MTGNPFTRSTRLGLSVVPVLAVLLALPGTTYAQRMTAELTGHRRRRVRGRHPRRRRRPHQRGLEERAPLRHQRGRLLQLRRGPGRRLHGPGVPPGVPDLRGHGDRLGAGDSRNLRNMPSRSRPWPRRCAVHGRDPADAAQHRRAEHDPDRGDDREHPDHRQQRRRLLRILPGMTPISGTNNQASFNGEIIGINGNGEGGQQSAIGNYSANGNQVKSLDITVDGAPGADPGCNCATSVNPNAEFIQEFKVLQSSFSAEYSKGPNSMSVVSKSGGRDFHGSAFLYFRDYHLNSNEWLGNKVGKERHAEQVRLPGPHVRRAPELRRLQQEPRQGVLLRRLRVLQAEDRHRVHPVVGPHDGHAQRRLQRARHGRLDREQRQEPAFRLPPEGSSRRTRSIPAAGSCSTSSPSRTPTPRSPAATTTSTTCWSTSPTTSS